MGSGRVCFGISAMVMSLLIVCGCAILRGSLGTAKVKPGVDVLAEDNFQQLKGYKVGLICNHSALSRKAKHLFDLMRKSENVELVAIFAPEHGFRGIAERTISLLKLQMHLDQRQQSQPPLNPNWVSRSINHPKATFSPTLKM